MDGFIPRGTKAFAELTRGDGLTPGCQRTHRELPGPRLPIYLGASRLGMQRWGSPGSLLAHTPWACIMG